MSIPADQMQAADNSSPQQWIRNAHEAIAQENWLLALEHWQKGLRGIDEGDQPQWHVGHAHTLIKLGRFNEASRVLEALGEHHPRFPPRYAELAVLAFDQEEWELAVRRWEVCISDFAADISDWWLHQYAECLYRLGRTDAAEQVLLRLVREFSTYPVGHAFLARIAQEKGAWALAAERWEACLQIADGEIRPAWQDAYLQALIRSDRLQEAARIIDALGRPHPQARFVHSKLAELAFQQGDWELATRRWEACIRKFADEIQPSWLHRHADCLNRLEQTDAAERVLLRLVREFPEHQGGQVFLARLAQKRGDWALAAERWEACLQVPGGEVRPAWQDAQIQALMRSDQLEEAARVIKFFGRPHPQARLIHSKLAELAFQQEEWELAAQRWEACIQDYAHEIQPLWLHRHAECLNRLKRTDAAEQVLLRLVRKFPEHQGGHELLAKLAQWRGDWALAAQRWEACLQVHGGDTHPAWWQGAYIQALMKSGRLEEAARSLESLGRRHPQARFVHSKLAELAFQQEEWELAAQRWEACIREYADEIQPLWLHRYAESLNRVQRTDAAEQVLLRLIRKFPEYPGGHAFLAKLAQQRGNWALAVERWENCLQIVGEKSNPAWQGAYAHALMHSGRMDKAAGILEPLIRQHPQDPLINCRLAVLALRQEDWTLAEQRWADCIRRFDDGTHPEWHKQHAIALIGLERYTEAIDILEEIEKGSQIDAQCLILLARAHYLNQGMTQCLNYAQRLMAVHPTSNIGFLWAEKALIKLGRFKEAADCYSNMPGKPALPPNPDHLPDNYPPQLVLPPIPGNGNDYGFIEQRLQEFHANGESFQLPVSIIIPVYNRARLLANTLAALARQTYPRHLMEVIVADDGSSDDIQAVLQKYRKILNLVYVRQEDQGYRVAAARNLGVRSAKHPYLIFLDCDVLPPLTLVNAYMGFFHVTNQAILMGLRDFVSIDGISDDDILQDPEIINHLPGPVQDIPHTSLVLTDGSMFDRRDPILIRTNKLKDDIFPFRNLASGNMAMTRSAYDRAGGFDERFQAWGGEDTEFAFRLSNFGDYLIPVPEAHAFHQESRPNLGESQVDREQGRDITQPLLVQTDPLCPDRDHFGGAVYEVPKVSVYMPAYNAAQFIREAVDSVLLQTFTDLEVVVCDDGSTDGTLSILETHYSNNPRVRWFSQPHAGISAATNRAVAACRGMYIGQLDADDLLEPTAVAAMVDLLDKHNVGYAYGRLLQIDRKGKPFREHPTREFSREYLLTDMQCSHFHIFRKRDWCRTAGCDESLESSVDYDLALKFSEICHIGYLPEITYRHRIHGANTSLVSREKQDNNQVAVINKALSRMGLAYAWRAVAGPADRKRLVRFQRLQAHVQKKPLQGSVATTSKQCGATGFLAGSGRSGTTWLMEIVNFDRSQRVLFEPFRVEDVPLPEGWHTHQYLHPATCADEHLETARTILGADIENGWIDKENNTDIGHRWFIKDIRANLFLKWLQVNFPHVPYILMLRHPCAVARSRCHSNWPWIHPRKAFLLQEDLMAEHLSGFEKLMQTVCDPFESKVVSWCVENLIPLRQFAPGELLVVFYEHLCLYPEREIKRVFDWLGRSYTPGVVAASRKPSALCRPGSAILNGADLIEHWRSDTSSAQIRRAMEICSQFGLDRLYGEESLPLVDSDQVLDLFT